MNHSSNGETNYDLESSCHKWLEACCGRWADDCNPYRELDELTYISELIGSNVTWEDYCPSW